MRVVGVILICFSIFFIIFVTAPSGRDIRILDSVCNAEINQLDIGQLSQKVFDYETSCTKISFLKLGMDFSMPLGIIGLVLFLIGIYAELGRKKNKEIFELKKRIKKHKNLLRKHEK